MMEACWMTAPFVTWRRSFGTETRRLSVQGNVEFCLATFLSFTKDTVHAKRSIRSASIG